MRKRKNYYGYTPSKIARMGEKEIRRIYSEYRKIANKRAARMRAAGYGDYEVAQTYFPTTKSLNTEELREQFADLNRYLRDVRTKIKPLKAYESEALKSLHKHGYKFVNHENFKLFSDFMDWARARAGANDRVYGSSRIAQMFQQKERLKISANALQKNFDYYLENLEAVKKVKRLEHTNRAMSDRELSSRIRKVLENDNSDD